MSEILSYPLWQGGVGAIGSLAIAVPLYRARGLKTTIVVALLLATAVVLGILVYRSATRLSGIAPGLSPAWTETVQSHAATRWYVDRLSGLPAAMPWYRPAGRDLTRDEAAPTLVRQPTHYLYYLSSLRGSEAWTAVFFWRTGMIPSLSLAGKSQLVLILESKEQDYLEIGMKDTRGVEIKVPLQVVPGWAGYRIPLAAFDSIDTESVQLLLLARDRGVESTDTNLLKIALIGAL